MRVLLEFSPNSCIFAYCFLTFLRVLLECGSYSRAGLFRGFTVFGLSPRILPMFSRFVDSLCFFKGEGAKKWVWCNKEFVCYKGNALALFVWLMA